MATATLVQALNRLVESGGTANRLVVSRTHGWFHCSAARGDRSILVEAAPSASLPKAQALSPNKVFRLRQLGFASRPGHKCLGRHVSLDNPGSIEALAEELHGLFDEVYGEGAVPDVVESFEGDRESTANPALIEAMRQMARKREHRLRTNLYRALLDSTLLLGVDSADPEQPAKVGELMGFDVYAAFSSWDALRRFEPRGMAYEAVRGRHLFGRLLEHHVGSLLIDPKSSVGGELYRNELETLAGASFGTRKH